MDRDENDQASHELDKTLYQSPYIEEILDIDVRIIILEHYRWEKHIVNQRFQDDKEQHENDHRFHQTCQCLRQFTLVR